MFKTIEVERIYEEKGEWFLDAVFKGETLNTKKHDIGSPVKAITYFGMEIKQEAKKWTVKVTLDL